MDQELKSKWVAALRSGEYKQGGEFLKRENRGETQHCCLGVLAEVMGIPNEQSAPRGGYDFSFPSGDYSGYLPFLENYDDTILSYETQSELAGMNDAGKPFTEIADYIEAHL